MPQLGRLQRVEPKAVWKHEAHDFTPWPYANIGLLADALGFDIDVRWNVVLRPVIRGLPAPAETQTGLA